MKIFPDDLEDEDDEELISPDSFGDDEDSDYYDKDEDDTDDLTFSDVW